MAKILSLCSLYRRIILPPVILGFQFMTNHDHDKDHDPYEPTSCSICFRYPDVHNTVQETKIVSHRKRMKLMFPSTKMAWAQHHPATMTDGGCYFWYFGRWYCPKTLNTQYICIYIYLHTYICTYIYIYNIYIYISIYVHTRPDPKPTNIQNDSCFFFRSKKNAKTPKWFYKIQRGV